MNYFTKYKINDHIYQLKDPMGVLTTLIIGNEKALLIDTSYGIGNLKQEIMELTNLPLIVVNSHGHMDHSCGNYLFDEVYISTKDIPLCLTHNSVDWRRRNLEVARCNHLIDESYDEQKYLFSGAGKLIPLEDDAIFNLGNLTIKVINMEGHTKGSLGFLIVEDQILVTSDAACPFVWLFLKESTPVHIYIDMLERVLKINFNAILLGHGNGKLLDKTRMIEFYEVAKSIDINKSVKVSFHNFENYNSYCYTTYKLYDQDGAGIIFDPEKM